MEWYLASEQMHRRDTPPRAGQAVGSAASSMTRDRFPADDVVELLQALVRVPQRQPDGRPRRGRVDTGEARCAECVAEAPGGPAARGPSCRKSCPAGRTCVGRFPTDRPGKPKLLLCPHLDTVSVRGMTIDPFAAERRDGRIYGRGACDTKGTMAAMLWALGELRDDLPRLAHEVWFAGLMGEEAGNEGAAALAADVRRTAISRWSASRRGCHIVHTTKGVTWLRLTRGAAPRKRHARARRERRSTRWPT